MALFKVWREQIPHGHSFVKSKESKSQPSLLEKERHSQKRRERFTKIDEKMPKNMMKTTTSLSTRRTITTSTKQHSSWSKVIKSNTLLISNQTLTHSYLSLLSQKSCMGVELMGNVKVGLPSETVRLRIKSIQKTVPYGLSKKSLKFSLKKSHL